MSVRVVPLGVVWIVGCAQAAASGVAVQSWRPAERTGVLSVALVGARPTGAQADESKRIAEEKCGGAIVVDDEGLRPHGVTVDAGHYAWVFHCAPPPSQAAVPAAGVVAEAGACVAAGPAAPVAPAEVHPDLDAAPDPPQAPAPAHSERQRVRADAKALYATAAGKVTVGDCTGAMPDLEQAMQLDRSYPEPLKLVAFCQKLAGNRQLACASARSYVARRKLQGSNAEHFLGQYCD